MDTGNFYLIPKIKNKQAKIKTKKKTQKMRGQNLQDLLNILISMENHFGLLHQRYNIKRLVFSVLPCNLKKKKKIIFISGDL